MRIIIDLQGAQASNKTRGIGRYSLGFARAIARNSVGNEIIIVLNGNFAETIPSIRAAFEKLLPQKNIFVFDGLSQVEFVNSSRSRREAAELVREHFIAQLEPDIVLVTSLFEGLADDAITSIGRLYRNIPTAVILYDLIPYIYRNDYLRDRATEAWYYSKIDHLRRADLLLAISGSSRKEAIEHIGFNERSVINISTAVESHFVQRKFSASRKQELRSRYNLVRPFVMYTGGIDARKNIEALIRSYAKLGRTIRSNYQLAIVCSVTELDRQRLSNLAKKEKLSPDEFVLTGFVPEDDLVDLYNLCTVFIFPSWHEGFGLPVLEAMSCGAPVIGANTSSLPEVIGRQDALFNPYSDVDIAASLTRVLTEEDFRHDLARHAIQQSKRFSWDETAKAALRAFKQWHERREGDHSGSLQSRPKLAYVSPLPPARTGISDYSAELLPELSSHYDIELVIAQTELDSAYLEAAFPVRTVEWFRQHARRYDRVLYHFGNSPFHEHMFSLLEEVPGTVILHDFYLSHIIESMDARGLQPNGLINELYVSHGYEALANSSIGVEKGEDAVWRYPCNWSTLQRAEGVIVHSASSALLIQQWYPNFKTDKCEVIPLLRVPHQSANRSESRKTLDLTDDQFVVCSFGMIGASKLNHKLLEAWNASELAVDERCHLVFVGENEAGEYGRQLEELIGSFRNSRVEITGWQSREEYCARLAAADIAVQLRGKSRGETSAAVLDCLNYGLPTIVNANGSMADLDERGVLMLPDEFTIEQLTAALEKLRNDINLRRQLGACGRDIVLKDHNPNACALKYYHAIERFYASEAGFREFSKAIGRLHPTVKQGELKEISTSVARNVPQGATRRRLFLDISELAQRDAKTGIQRVVRSVLRQWLFQPPSGVRIEPVYFSPSEGVYRYARKFTLRFLSCSDDGIEDDVITFERGDVFLGLDLQAEDVPAQRSFYSIMMRAGVRVHFIVYDLLCVLSPQYFVPGAEKLFSAWLDMVATSDGAICISQSVATELRQWISTRTPSDKHNYSIDWFHLGADLGSSAPTKGIPENSAETFDALRLRPSFLMVGTVEPRKGHAQVLGAFENLWSRGVEANLVIIGKKGWLVDTLVNQLQSHPELNKRLFWLDGISDEYLEKIYECAVCLIAASECEGFGLPLIESAQHCLPIIARDIPVFREVAGKHAFYFSGAKAEAVAEAVEQWMLLYANDMHPKSDAMPWLTWKQSVDRLNLVLFGELD